MQTHCTNLAILATILH